MPVRLLAYGGTLFVERRRFGSWPRYEDALLGDIRALEGGKSAFGVGRAADSDPFLIIREPQKRGDRIYAFTLLIDPGRETWERFQWNAARLALSLRSSDPFGHRVFTSPDHLTDDEITSCLSALAPPPAHTPGGSTNARALWTALALAQLDGVVLVRPSDFGFPEVPSLQTTASFLDELWPACRIGPGWLFGGRIDHSRFGVGLIVDPEVERITDVERLVHSGGCWLSLAASLESTPASESWRKLRATPATEWEWPSTLVTEHAERYLRLQQTHQPIESENLPSSGPFVSELNQAFWETISSGTGQLGPGASTIVLERFRARLSDDLIRRLDNLILLNLVSENNSRPWHADNPLRLPEDVLVRVTMKFISMKPPESRPALLAEALQNGGANWESLIDQACLQSLLFEAPSLTTWASCLRNTPLDALVNSLLLDQLFRRVREDRPGWANDYLSIKPDLGGNWIRKIINRERFDRLLDEVVRLLGTDLKESAENWLRSLAQSDKRREIRLEKKLALAKLVDDNWSEVGTLNLLLAGGREKVRSQATNETRAFLEEEALELAKPARIRNSIPNIIGLVQFLGGCPEELQRSLESLKPWSDDDEQIENWVQGWSLCGRPDITDRERSRITEAKRKRENEELLAWVSHGNLPRDLQSYSVDSLATFCIDLLYGRSPKDEEQIIVELNRHPNGRAALEKAILQEENLSRTLLPGPPQRGIVEQLLLGLSDKARLRVAKQLLLRPDFRKLSIDLLRRFLLGGRQLKESPALIKTIARFLDSEEGKPVRDEIEREFPVAKMELVLRKLTGA